MLEVEVLLADEGKGSPWSSHNDVWAVVLQRLLVLGDWEPTKEHGAFDPIKILGEPLVLLVDLKGKLPGVAEHEDTDLSIHGLNLLEGGNHEDGRLAHAALGLTDDIHSKDGLGDALVLNCGWSGEGEEGMGSI